MKNLSFFPKSIKKLCLSVIKDFQRPFADLFLLFAITIVVYLPIFRIPFTFDAITFLFRWKEIHSFSHIPALLLGNVPTYNEGVYRPVRSLFYVVSYFLGYNNSFFYHLEELVVYLVCIWLVYVVTKNLMHNRFVAFVTTLLFSLHPFHVDNVANLTASFDSFGLAFFFLSFYLFQRFLFSQEKKWYLLSLFAASLAFFTYEVTLILPLLFILYAWHVKSPIRKKYFLGYFFFVFLYLFIRIFMLHITTRGAIFEYIPEKIAGAVETTASYTIASLLPMPDTFSLNLPPEGIRIPDPKPVQTIRSIFFTKDFFFSGILLFTIGILSFFLRKKRTFIFLLLWFYISFIPAILILIQSEAVTLTRSIYGRYIFIPSFSACLLVGIVLYSLSLQIKKRRPVFQFFPTLGFAYITLLPVYFLFVTIHGIYQFKDYRTEFAQAVQKISNKSIRYNDLGILHLNDRNLDKAIEDFSIALSLDPTYSIAKINLQRTKQIKAMQK